jgi:NAD(P)-dependent dehydrogenase (short-subunit alcohol dehydrogenase family)
MTLRFDGDAVVVTGAGGGLGRAHALLMASRGARVVVNDLGAARDGAGASPAPAEAVVAEIRDAGGTAVASADDISTPEGAERLAARALDAFGRIDALVNNAGFLRDRSFAKMPPGDFEAVLGVHLMGSVHATRAVWPHMAAAGHGRIVMTTSATGLYGNFGQSNYGAAKLGVVGLMLTLAQEGRKSGIAVNALSPVAATRMTDGTLPPEIVARTPPELVAPAAAYLCSRACALTGRILVAGGGRVALARIVETAGVTFPPGALTPEAVAERIAEIADLSGARPFDSAMEELSAALGLGGT